MNVTNHHASATKKNTKRFVIIANARMNNRNRDCRSGYGTSNVSGYSPASSENGGYSSRSSATYAMTFACHRNTPDENAKNDFGYRPVNRIANQAITERMAITVS